MFTSEVMFDYFKTLCKGITVVIVLRVEAAKKFVVQVMNDNMSIRLPSPIDYY